MNENTPTSVAETAVNGAAPDGGWQKELTDAVKKTSMSNGTGNAHPDPAPSGSSIEPPQTADAGRTKPVMPIVIASTKEGRDAYLAAIDGDRPIADGSAPDNAVASFRASDVYVAAGSSRDVPIPVWTANSTVTVVKVGVDDEHCEGFDVGFSLYLTSPDGGGGSKVSVVEADRRITTIGSGAKPAMSFQVEQVPATVLLKFDNSYSWINSKRVVYHVEVKPPIDEAIVARSRRAEAAIDALALAVNKAKEGVSQIQTVRQSVGKKAADAKEKKADRTKELEAKVEAFKGSVKQVKQLEQALKEKEQETEKNEVVAKQMNDEKDQIQARIEKLRKELAAAESELEAKGQQIEAQHELIVTNKQAVLAMEEDIDNRLDGIEKSGAEVKAMESSLKEVEQASAEASKEHAIIVEEEEKATEHLKFHEKLFEDLKLRLLEKPQEV